MRMRVDHAAPDARHGFLPIVGIALDIDDDPGHPRLDESGIGPGFLGEPIRPEVGGCLRFQGKGLVVD
jgi:hypothetical protein